MITWNTKLLARTAAESLSKFSFKSIAFRPHEHFKWGLRSAPFFTDMSFNGLSFKAFAHAISYILLLHAGAAVAGPGIATISGTAEQGQIMIANVSDDDGTTTSTFSYQWKRDSVNISGANAATYNLVQADVGTQITVTVSYTDDLLNSENVTSSAKGPVVNINDAPTGSVTISGVAEEDQTLTAGTGTINDADGLGSFSYQWKRNNSPISGATGASYTLIQADVNTQISVTVSYVDGGGASESLTSGQTASIANSNDEPVGVPVINGTAKQGETLTADASGISDADGLGSFSYLWKRDGNPISGATGSSYTLVQADVNTQISVTVSYVDGGGTSESRTSAQTASVTNINDEPVGVPVISGTAKQGETLIADTSGISDADGLGSFSYLWKRDGNPISGATGSSYTLVQADVNTQISVTVSYVDGGGTSESRTSAQTASVTNSNDEPVGVPVISGTVIQGETLTADASGISDADGLGNFSYQWNRGGNPISGATGTSYTLVQADVNTQISVTVSYEDGGGTNESQTSGSTAPVANSNDEPVGVPVISGTAKQGETLTVNTSGISDADGLGAFTYIWKRNNAPISGATNVNYVLVQEDVNALISVTVNYVDGGGTAESRTSSAVGPVANINDPASGTPVIVSDSLSQGGLLTVDTSPITDADGLGVFSYQWLRDAVAITGATASSYTLSQADVGRKMSVTVSYTDGGGTPESLTSAETAEITNTNNDPVGKPVISGIARQGETLTADVSGISDADGVGEFSYQWLRSEGVISEAVSPSYVLTQEDVGASISVRVTYTDGDGTSESIVSDGTAAVVNVNDPPVGVPVISGDPIEDQILTADVSLITDDDGLGEFSYQWLRNGVAIVGATTQSYVLLQIDVGSLISVQVSYIDGSSTAETVKSAETTPIQNVNDLPVGVVTISGSVVQNQVLTADASSITDEDGLGELSYQWLRGGEAILDATTSSYTLKQADVGAFISVTVSYTDGQGTLEIVTSGTVGPVGNVNDEGVVTIAGGATHGSLLTVADISDADGTEGSNFSYQWLRDGVNIAGETGDSYRVNFVDIGKFISVVVSYIDDPGTAETVVSNEIGAIRPDVPKVTAPPDISPVNATGWFTFVDLDPNSVATAFDTLDDSFITPVPDSNGQFRPGTNIVTWSATDEAGNVGTATQIVKIIPLVEVSKVQRVAEGSSAELRISLNGDALAYPVTVPFTVSNSDLGTGGANNSDHDLVAGSATISEPAAGELPETVIAFNIVEDGLAEGVENLLVTLTGSPVNAVLGADKTHTIEIHEGNVAPQVNLEASQLQLDTSSSTVTVYAMASDKNDGDTLSYEWSTGAIIISELMDGVFTFEPSDLSPGIYTVRVKVTDDSPEMASASDDLVFRITEELPELSVTDDTDGDGEPDATDGLGDSDGDGVADYLDSIQAGQVVQILSGISDEFVMQTEAGLKLSLGNIAVVSNTGASLVSEEDVINPELGGTTEADTIENIGGYFDFNISGLSVPGQVVNVVIPQVAAMPRVSVYRKLTASGWQDFVQDGNNIVSSALGEKGYCPPPGDAAYQPGLKQGHWCLQLTIEDGGPNDEDGEANLRITDPGGVGRILSGVTVNSSGGGGSFSPLVVILSAFILFVFRTMKYKERKIA